MGEPKNKETLAKVLTYHVVAGAVLSKDLTNNEIIKTVEGENVTAHVTAAGVKINDATVKTADVIASNGVIHIIDSVLLPAGVPLPAMPTKNIVELASGISDLSTLVTALKAGELTTALSAKGPFTVFAPTNKAFLALPNGTLAHLLDPKNIKTLQSVLEYHVIANAAVRSFDLKSTQLVKTLESQDVNITKRDGSIFVNNAEVITANADTTNGVVHIIDQVLIPPSIVGVAVTQPDLSTLVTALKAGGLVDTLSGAGPFTVFAPTNEAFAKLPPIVLQMLLEPKNTATLAKVLTYHVVAGAVLSKDLTNNEIIKTVEGENVTAHVTAAGVKINDTTVKTADVIASNGVIHIIDSVLLPAGVPLPAVPTKNIVELASGISDLSTLVTALKAGELTTALSAKGPFTVFAPTNKAFLALPNGTLAHLLDPKNIKTLQSVLE